MMRLFLFTSGEKAWFAGTAEVVPTFYAKIWRIPERRRGVVS
jgi:hypothetical protein